MIQSQCLDTTKFIYLFYLERKGKSRGRGRGQRERENLKLDPQDSGAQSPTQGSISQPWDFDLGWNQESDP